MVPPLRGEAVTGLARFLGSGRWCRWSQGDALAGTAHELARTSANKAAAISAMNAWVALNVAYDHDKADRLRGGRDYVPDPESTYESGDGVCFDMASLLAAMLRAVGIPAKIVVGTADGESHAWVHAWDGRHWLRCDPALAREQGRREYVARYEL